MSGWGWKSETTQISSQVRAAAEAGIDDALQQIFDDSQSLVPVDTSQLKNSGRIVRDGLTGAIVYDSTIATAVHEDLTTDRDGGQAKFLESAFNQNRAAAAQTIADRVRRKISS